MQADGFQAVNTLTTEILGRKGELKQLGDRIDGLETLVQRVKQDVDKLESLLNTAESEANLSDGAPILRALGSLFTVSVFICWDAHKNFTVHPWETLQLAFYRRILMLEKEELWQEGNYNINYFLPLI